MAYNTFDQLESYTAAGDFVGADSMEMFNKTNKRPHAGVEGSPSANRPSFKGSLEDLVMITNFKRFKRKGSSSRYKGVFYVKKEKKYRAQICLKGKKKYVGTFKNDKEAAIARDQRIREMFGEVEELLNFPLCKAEDISGAEHSNADTEKTGFGLGVSDLGQTGNAMLSNLATAEDETVASKNRQSNNIRDMRSRLSTLTRYGSSGCSLSFPANFGFLNDANENPSGILDMNQTINGFNYGNFDTQAVQGNQSNGSLLNTRYNSYGMNPLMGFNLQDLSAPRGSLLAKRFSSNDSYGFGSNTDQLPSSYSLSMLQSPPNNKYNQFTMGVQGTTRTAQDLEKQTRAAATQNGGHQV